MALYFAAATWAAICARRDEDWKHRAWWQRHPRIAEEAERLARGTPLFGKRRPLEDRLGFLLACDLFLLVCLGFALAHLAGADPTW